MNSFFDFYLAPWRKTQKQVIFCIANITKQTFNFIWLKPNVAELDSDQPS
jgi:hypothetical protein